MTTLTKQLLVVALIAAVVIAAILLWDWWQTRQAIESIPLWAFSGGRA